MACGPIEAKLFDLGLGLEVIHEFHRICTIASVFSWGRFYAVPHRGKSSRDFVN